jgi:hypothetical protein
MRIVSAALLTAGLVMGAASSAASSEWEKGQVKTLDGKIVVADAEKRSVTVKLPEGEKTFLVEGAPSALKVLRPGDEVKLAYRDLDGNGVPEAVTAVWITRPARS